MSSPTWIAFALPTIATLLAAGLPPQDLRLLDRSPVLGATHDPVRQRTVGVGLLGETLEFDGAGWRQRALPRRPWDARGGRLVFDQSLRRVLAIGGTSANLPGIETWAFDGVDWQHRIPPNFQTPGSNFGLAMAYDRARGNTVLFGGATYPLATTWLYDGSTWTGTIAPPTPPARYGATLAYDSQRARVVLFGGRDAAARNDTWEWNGTSWMQVLTATTPPPRMRASMTFDPTRNRTILFGGRDPTLGWLSDVWEYDGVTWHAISPAGPAPAAREQAPFPFDATLGVALLTSGRDANGRLLDTWAWNGTTWQLLDAPAQPGFHPFGMAMASPTGDEIVLFVGNDPVQSETWLWNKTAWSEHAGGSPPPRSYAISCTGATCSYLGGGIQLPSGAPLLDLWGWDGTAWTQLPGQLPVPSGGVIAFDWARGELVLFGGRPTTFAGLDETWVFDGQTWQQRQPASSPPPRFDHSMTYDFARQRIVLFGGRHLSTNYQDTWEWDGASWTQVVTAAQPPSGLSIMAFDEVRQRTVLIVPPPTSPYPTVQAWLYDGTDWSAVPIGNPLELHLPVRSPLVGSPYPRGLALLNDDNLFAFDTAGPRSSHYGAACGNSAPDLAGNLWPQLGTQDFGIDVVRGPASATVALQGAVQSASIQIAGCILLVQPGQAVWLLPTSPAGFATAPVPLPNNPAFLGVELFFQAAALDPTVPTGFTLSRGLQITSGE